MSGHANVFWFVLAWGAAAAAGAAVAPLQARVVPNLAGATEWLWRHRDLGPRYLAENTGGNASDTVRSYGISYILGLAAVGYIQAASVLMGPFKIIFFGISLITLPEAARLLRRSPRHLPLFCAAVSTGLTLLALAWGAVLLVALPRGLGHLMLGSIWRPTYPLVLPTALAIMSQCAPVPARAWACTPWVPRAAACARRSLPLCSLWPLLSGSPDGRHARYDAFYRRRIVDRHAGVLVAVAPGAARDGHHPRTRLAVAGPPSGTSSQDLRGYPRHRRTQEGLNLRDSTRSR